MLDRLNKIRLCFTGFLIIFDILFLPHVINLFFMFKAGTVLSWPDTLSILGGLFLLPKVFPIWKSAQILILGFIVWIWLNGRGFVKVPVGDTPPATGHGQHGTSRWMNQKEVEQVFTIKEM